MNWRRSTASVEPMSWAAVPPNSPSSPIRSAWRSIGITLAKVTDKLANANRSFLAGALRDNGRAVPAVAGQTLQGIPDIDLLLLTSRDGRPVYVKDVADVTVEQPRLSIAPGR